MQSFTNGQPQPPEQPVKTICSVKLKASVWRYIAQLYVAVFYAVQSYRWSIVLGLHVDVSVKSIHEKRSSHNWRMIYFQRKRREDLGLENWRLRWSIHLTSATIRQCRINTFTSFARTKAKLFLHVFLTEKRGGGIARLLPTCDDVTSAATRRISRPSLLQS